MSRSDPMQFDLGIQIRNRMQFCAIIEEIAIGQALSCRDQIKTKGSGCRVRIATNSRHYKNHMHHHTIRLGIFQINSKRCSEKKRC
jgi:hypothetical protein